MIDHKKYLAAIDCPSAWTHEAMFYKNYLAKEIIGEVFTIVEIGVHFGYSLFVMAHDFPEASLFGVDNFTMHDSDRAREHLNAHLPNFNNIRLLEGNSVELAKQWGRPENYLDIDVLHIDGGHTYDEAKADFDSWSKYVRQGGVVMFHDVRVFRDKGPGELFDQLVGKKHIEGNLGIWYKEGDLL